MEWKRARILIESYHLKQLHKKQNTAGKDTEEFKKSPDLTQK